MKKKRQLKILKKFKNKKTNKQITNNEQNNATYINIKKKKRRRRRKIILNIILILFLLFLIAAIAFSIYIVTNAPKFKPENLYSTDSSIIYDKNGTQIAKLGVEKRRNVKYSELPEVLLDAIIATEDSRFMQHNGVDLPRFLKASFGQIINKITGRGNAGGGSTLDMQVVKNRYTSTEDSGIEGIIRKFTDMYISMFKLEKNYSKEEIMEFYVNIPFLGNQSYGVEQACQSYFGKSVSDINLSEAAIIAGLFQAPSSYDPYRYPENAEERRETVLYLMQRHGYITKEEADIANSIPVKSLLRPSNPETGSNPYQSYINVVIDEVIEKTDQNPYTVGMKIYTNLDTNKQNQLSDIMSGKTWEWKDDKIQAGIAIVDINNGALLAVGGGRNQNGERVMNYATDINRHIGSCAKPLFDYGPAIEYHGASLASQVYDGPHTYSSGNNVYNADGRYLGLLTYKYALAASRNVPALKVFQSNDNAKVREFVKSLGIRPEEDANGFLHEAHALGAFNGASPIELAGAYAAFANGGYFAKPYSIDKIEYIDTGKTVSLKSKRNRVMSDSTAYMITDALLYAVNSYGNIYGSVPGVQLAAKTGTSTFDESARRELGYPSEACMDMWVTGYTPEYAVSLWYGYTDAERGYYLGSEGYYARGELYRQIIAGISDRSGTKTFSVPNSVVKVTIEKETAPSLLPGPNTPDDMKVTEYFKRGTQPTEVSHRFDTLPNPSGLTAKESGGKIELSWNAAAKPAYLSDEALKKSLSGVYGKRVDEAVASRKAAEGDYGYEILAEDKVTNTTTSLGFTTTSAFKVDKPIHDTVYYVKTCFEYFSLTHSSGISVEVKGTKKDEPEETPSSLTYTINGNESDTATINTAYTDPGITVYSDGKDVTSKATITVTCSELGTSKGQKESYTFTSAGKYTLTYTMKYDNQTETATRTITVKDTESSEQNNN